MLRKNLELLTPRPTLLGTNAVALCPGSSRWNTYGLGAGFLEDPAASLGFLFSKNQTKAEANGAFRSADRKQEYFILFFFRVIYDDNQDVKPLNNIIKRKAGSFSPLAFKLPQKAGKKIS